MKTGRGLDLACGPQFTDPCMTAQKAEGGSESPVFTGQLSRRKWLANSISASELRLLIDIIS